MHIWRHIPALCAILFLFASQCRAQCLVVPHATEQQMPECPLHKSKAPKPLSESGKCSHAPQWDVDDARVFDFLLPAPLPSVLEILEAHRPVSVPLALGVAPPVPITLRI